MRDAAWVFGSIACCFAVLGTLPGYVMALLMAAAAYDCWRT